MKVTLSVIYAAVVGTEAPIAPQEGIVGYNVYDGTNQTSAESLSSVLPGLFEQRVVGGSGQFPTSWSVGFVKANEEDKCHALYPVEDDWLVVNKMTQLRFAEVPDEGGSFSERVRSVGLATPTSINRPLEKGLFLGSQGNLQDGNQALRVGFTDSFDSNAVVDWFIEVRPSNQTGLWAALRSVDLDIYLVVNNRSYGHAFSVPNLTADDMRQLKPVVRFDCDVDSAVAVVLWAAIDIDSLATYREKQGNSGLGLTGDWIDSNGVVLHVAEKNTKLSSLTHTLDINTKIGNYIAVEYDIGLLGQVLERGQIKSTMMMPPANLYKLEQTTIEILDCAESFTLNDQKQLLIRCTTDDQEDDYVYSRYVDLQDHAVALNPWNQ